MNIGSAIQQLRLGKRVARKVWEVTTKTEGNPPKVTERGFLYWLLLIDADGYDILSARIIAETIKTGQGLNRKPWIALKTLDNALIPYMPTHADLLEDDWVTIR